MTTNFGSPWHAESFDRWLHDRLPRLLSQRLPLADYRVAPDGPHTCRIDLTIASAAASYRGIPLPDADGVFVVDSQPRVVLPTAASSELSQAELRCVGEQLYDYVETRLGQAPDGLAWDAALARAWLPLDEWVHGFLTSHPTAQPLDETNWLARQAHLRRLLVRNPEQPIMSDHLGRICPVEALTGPEIGRLLTIATGATIRDGRLAIVDQRPAAILGATAATIPFIEHSDVARLLMGAKMMRDWLPPPDPEPALVQTGSEPDAPELWSDFAQLLRRTTSAESAVRIITAFHHIDVSEAARQLQMPTMIFHGRDDLRVPFDQAREYAALIEGSQLVPLDTRNHLMLPGEPAWHRFLGDLRRFLDEADPS